MSENEISISKILRVFIDASAGTKANFWLNFFGQFAMGLLYSLGHLPFHAVGILLGFVMPGIWVVCSYRLVKASAIKQNDFPLPAWMLKEPGNTLVILIDLLFLATIWVLIISGLFNKIWIKLIFTVAFPLLTLFLLRHIVLLLTNDRDFEKE